MIDVQFSKLVVYNRSISLCIFTAREFEAFDKIY